MKNSRFARMTLAVILCFSLSVPGLAEEKKKTAKTQSTMILNLDSKIREINETRRSINMNGLHITAGWAVANVAGGILIERGKTGETKWFWHGNWIWNLFTLGIVGLGYWDEYRNSQRKMGLVETLEEVSFNLGFYAVLSGLDVGFITAGIVLREAGFSATGPTRNKRLGYGKTLIVQGTFLLLMDGISYLLQNSNAHDLYDIFRTIHVTENSIGIRVAF